MSVDLPMAELVLRYLNQEGLDERQAERLKLWLSDPENLKILEAQFRDPDWLASNLRVADHVNEIDHWRKFLEKLEMQGESLVNAEEEEEERVEPAPAEEAPVRWIWGWKVTAAATIVGLLLVGGVVWKYGRHGQTAGGSTDNAVVAADLPPGGKRALLTLANGSTIVLDSAGNGDLAQQGATKVIKVGGGLLSYHAGNANGMNAKDANQKNANDANNTNNEVLYNTVATPAGGQYQIVLTDGSRVWLNAASTLRFPTVFGGTRTVQVTGQAYFEVAKDPKKPFLVQSGDNSIAVLGTSFDLKAYTDEPFTAVTLESGAIRVQQGATQETLRPGQQAQMSGGGIRVDDHVNLRQVTAWKDGLFKFYNSDIQTIMREIGRWYNVQIVYEGKVPDDRFTGTMDKSLNASDVLKILALSKVHFRIEGQKIVVMPD